MTEKERIKRVLLLMFFAVLAGLAIDRGKKSYNSHQQQGIEAKLNAEGRQMLSIDWVKAKVESHRTVYSSHYRVRWVDAEGKEGVTRVEPALWGEDIFEDVDIDTPEVEDRW